MAIRIMTMPRTMSMAARRCDVRNPAGADAGRVVVVTAIGSRAQMCWLCRNDGGQTNRQAGQRRSSVNGVLAAVRGRGRGRGRGKGGGRGRGKGRGRGRGRGRGNGGGRRSGRV